MNDFVWKLLRQDAVLLDGLSLHNQITALSHKMRDEAGVVERLLPKDFIRFVLRAGFRVGFGHRHHFFNGERLEMRVSSETDDDEVTDSACDAGGVFR